ncbi:MAG: YbhB/YbcL family Raf kinase inhibitor-like protein [Candidatus Omnitrophota bacterium]
MKKIIFFFLAVLVVVFSAMAREGLGGGAMRLSSPAFKNNDLIPRKFTCEGEDINPELLIEGVPGEAKSLALIMDDSDAPIGTWVHWVVYNIPITTRIEENSVPGEQAMNDFRRKDYGGPCPPSGVHRYFFKIYALDAVLDLRQGAGKRDLEKAMEGHLLDKAELIGLYRKQ